LQHGEDECYLNIIQACAINLWPDLVKPALSDKYLTVNRNKHGEKTSIYCNLEDTIQPQNEIDLQLLNMQKKHFDFIKCIEKQYKAPDRNGAEESWEVCSGILRLSTQSIKKCYDSGHGKEVWFIH
jgi:interferon gamma-inducible protein 30